MLLSAVENAASGITTTADFFDLVHDRDHAEAGLKALQDAPVGARLLNGMKSKIAADMIDLDHVEEWQRGWDGRSDDGRVVKREGQIVGIDVPALLNRASRSLRAVRARAKGKDV